MVRGKDSVSNQFDLLVDSDVFVGWMLPNDALSQKVQTIFYEIKTQQKQWVTTNWVVAETATVLSHRDSQQTAVNFLTMIEEGEIPILTVTPELEQVTYQVFREQSIKNISMIDCSNVALAQHYQIPQLLTFDHFYTRYGYEIQRVNQTPQFY
jgi:predicted nucleic acid-binding protein